MKKLFFSIVALITISSCHQKPKDKDVAFGIDISQYQGDINWSKVKKAKHPIEFVIIRATMGANKKDEKFKDNLKNARDADYLVGAYHYYRPDEPSEEQAKNYLETINLQKGDFIPIVDLEKLSTVQSVAKLKSGLKNWLDIVEKEYGVKPMIYTGCSFYESYLAKEFAEYPLWVAAYSQCKRQDPTVRNSEIHQFAEKVPVKGIKGRVDGNDIRREKLPSLVLN